MDATGPRLDDWDLETNLLVLPGVGVSVPEATPSLSLSVRPRANCRAVVLAPRFRGGCNGAASSSSSVYVYPPPDNETLEPGTAGPPCGSHVGVCGANWS